MTKKLLFIALLGIIGKVQGQQVHHESQFKLRGDNAYKIALQQPDTKIRVISLYSNSWDIQQKGLQIAATKNLITLSLKDYEDNLIETGKLLNCNNCNKMIGNDKVIITREQLQNTIRAKEEEIKKLREENKNLHDFNESTNIFNKQNRKLDSDEEIIKEEYRNTLWDLRFITQLTSVAKKQLNTLQINTEIKTQDLGYLKQNIEKTRQEKDALHKTIERKGFWRGVFTGLTPFFGFLGYSWWKKNN